MNAAVERSSDLSDEERDAVRIAMRRVAELRPTPIRPPQAPEEFSQLLHTWMQAVGDEVAPRTQGQVCLRSPRDLTVPHQPGCLWGARLNGRPRLMIEGEGRPGGPRLKFLRDALMQGLNAAQKGTVDPAPADLAGLRQSACVVQLRLWDAEGALVELWTHPDALTPPGTTSTQSIANVPIELKVELTRQNINAKTELKVGDLIELPAEALHLRCGDVALGRAERIPAARNIQVRVLSPETS